jgi:hypothetical protein
MGCLRAPGALGRRCRSAEAAGSSVASDKGGIAISCAGALGLAERPDASLTVVNLDPLMTRRGEEQSSVDYQTMYFAVLVLPTGYRENYSQRIATVVKADF